MPKESRWRDIFAKLKEHEIPVYAPGQKIGECKEPYVVVKSAGRTGLTTVSSSQNLYDLLCYVPLSKYSMLDIFVDQIETIMDELFPMFRPVHYRSASFLDNEVKAHMVSVQYVNYTKNTRR